MKVDAALAIHPATIVVKTVAQPNYVLICVARNEAATLPITLECVIRQTVKPDQFLVVSDSSTDQTDAIVLDYSTRCPWIKLLQISGQAKRSFAAKVAALNQGLDTIRSRAFTCLGLIDADVRFDNSFVEQLLGRFEADSLIGVAGGLVVDVGRSVQASTPSNLHEVAGAALFIRRACLDRIGRFMEIPEGGFDTITAAMARMNGFKTVTFPDLVVDHLKPRSGAAGSCLKRCFQWGARDYAVGNHPLFEVVKCVSRFREHPPVLGAVLRFSGYMMRGLQAQPRAVPTEVVRALRREQWTRISPLRRRNLLGMSAG